MRFEVPQFIEVEDKIIGPFTWKQFVYLAGGSGILVILYFSAPFFIFAVVGLPFGALAGFLAFHKINNRPFSIFLESLVSYTTGTKLYLWKKNHEQAIVYKEEVPVIPTDAALETRGGKLSSLSRKLELNTLGK